MIRDNIQQTEYVVTNNRSDTICPFGDESYVGSIWCSTCPHFIKNDSLNQILYCTGVKGEE